MINKCLVKHHPSKGLSIIANSPIKSRELIGNIKEGLVTNKQTEHSLQIDFDKHFETDEVLRYVNHSCEPNAAFQPNKNGFYDLIAITDINVTEEITFDYATTEFICPNFYKYLCCCGSNKCRHIILGYKFLSKELKSKYAKISVPYLQKRAPLALELRAYFLLLQSLPRMAKCYTKIIVNKISR